MAEEELQVEDGGKGKSKMMLIIIIAVVLIGGGAAAYFLLFAGGDEPTEEQLAQTDAAAAEQAAPAPSGNAEIGTALYVAMPRPFVFNVPGTGRDRLVQIKVQLLVRGSENEEIAKTHIPLIEGTLLQAFSASNADDLITEAGKIELREQAVVQVQKALKEIEGKDVVERVLFTGFVMQ